MKLFISSRIWCRKENDKYITQRMDGKYIDILASLTSKAYLGITVSERKYNFLENYDYVFRSKNIVICPFKRKLDISKASLIYANLYNLIITIRNIIRSDNVFIFMSSFEAFFAAFISKLFNKKYIVYSGNDWENDAKLKYNNPFIPILVDKLQNFVFNNAQYSLVNSSLLYSRYSNLNNIERTKPISQFSISDYFFRENTCLGDTIKIITLGAIIPRKNYETFIKSIKKLTDINSKKIEVIILGGISDEKYFFKIQGLIKQLNLEDIFLFKGYVSEKNEIHEYLKSSDLFILTSLNEGFPRAVWEAMLHGLPCIVSDIENIKNDLDSKDVALLSDPNDDEKFAYLLNEVINNSELRKSLIKNSFNYIKDIFNETSDEQVSRILKSIK